MPLTPTERDALRLACTKGGTPLDTINPDITALLIASDLITEHDHKNIGEWTLLATTAGRKLYLAPIYKRAPVRLMYRARMPHPDPLEKGTVPEPEIVDPLPADIRRARDLGVQQRASFQRDLEAERARRKRDRVQRMFRDAA